MRLNRIAVALALAAVAGSACSSSDANGTGGTPATISVVAGNAQSAAAGAAAPTPITAQVRDQNGSPVSGAVVTFTASGGAKLRYGQVLSDASGNVSTTITLGSTVGTDSVVATAGGVAAPAIFTIDVHAGPAAALVVVRGSGQLGITGSALPSPLIAQVTDLVGNPVAGATIDWTTSAGTLVGNAQQISAPDGTVSIVLQLPGTAENVSVAATLHGTTSGATFSEVATDGIATTLTVLGGDLQSGTAGTTLPNPFVVRVTDQHNNPVAGATIDWTTTDGVLNGLVSQTTAADGTASIGLQLPATTGTVTITATLHGTATAVTLTAIAN